MQEHVECEFADITSYTNDPLDHAALAVQRLISWMAGEHADRFVTGVSAMNDMGACFDFDLVTGAHGLNKVFAEFDSGVGNPLIFQLGAGLHWKTAWYRDEYRLWLPEDGSEAIFLPLQYDARHCVGVEDGHFSYNTDLPYRGIDERTAGAKRADTLVQRLLQEAARG